MPPRGKATIQDVARLADVSPTTVSMILRGKTGVSFSQETVDRVLKAAEQLDYKKNTAKGCFDRPTIAIVMGLITSIYYTSFITNCYADSSKWRKKISDRIFKKTL